MFDPHRVVTTASDPDGIRHPCSSALFVLNQALSTGDTLPELVGYQIAQIAWELVGGRLLLWHR